MRPRNHRIVRLAVDGHFAWLVVSTSLRDDETWDVLYRGRSREACEDYVRDVDRRHTMLSLAGRG